MKFKIGKLIKGKEAFAARMGRVVAHITDDGEPCYLIWWFGGEDVEQFEPMSQAIIEAFYESVS